MIKILLIILSFNLYSNNLHIENGRFFGFNQYNLVYLNNDEITFSYLKHIEIDEYQKEYNHIGKSNIIFESLNLKFSNANYKNIKGIKNNEYNIFNFNKIDNIKLSNNKEIQVKNIYKDIDFNLKYNNNDYEFNFVISPFAKIENIELERNDFILNENGELYNNNFIISKPVAFYKDSPSSYIEVNYEIFGDIIKFKLREYDSTKTIIIDPIIKIKGTYYGGIAIDRFYDMDVDGNGNQFASGLTLSTAQIAFNGHQNIKDAGYDAFMVKFDKDGNRIWGTYFGGEYDDIAFSCKVKNNNILMAGRMSSELFQMTANAHQSSFGGADDDGFFVEFASDGSVIYSTYYGGEGNDAINGIDYSNGAVYITGYTRSSDRIASGGHQNTFGGLFDCFVARFENGSRDWGTYFGGINQDFGNNIVVKNNRIIVVGSTNSSSAIASNGYSNSLNGKYDGFFAEFRVNGELLRSSYFGGSEDDFLFAADYKDGKYYLLGVTYSNNLPVNSHQNSIGGTADGFIAIIEGVSLLKSTYYGGSLAESFYDIKVTEDIYITGATRSDDKIAFNTTNNFRNGNFDAILSRFDEDLNIIYGNYLGGVEEDVARSIFVRDSIIYLAGYSASAGVFSLNGHQNNNNGDTDAFLTIYNDLINRIIEIKYDDKYCVGKSYIIDINPNFELSENNIFTIYISDKDGNLNNKIKIDEYVNNPSQIIFNLPTNLDYSDNYKIEITSSNPKSKVISENITIYPELKYNIFKDTLCPDEKFMIVANSYPTSVNEWYYQDVLVNIGDTLNEGFADAGNYKIKIIQKNELCENEKIVDVIYKNKINLNIIGETDVCINSIQTYTFLTNSSNKVDWSIQGGLLYETTDTSVSVEWNTMFGSLTGSIRATNTDCGVTQRISINVTRIDPQDIIGNDTSCVECRETYYIPNIYDNIEWEAIGGEILTSNTISNIEVRWFETPAILKVKYKIGDCFQESIITIFYLEEPRLQISPNISRVCLNDEVIFTTSFAEFLSFNWTAINCEIIEEKNNIIKIKFNNEGESEIILNRYNNIRDENEIISKKIIVSSFETNISEIKNQICLNEEILISNLNENQKLNIQSRDYNLILESNDEIKIYYYEIGIKKLTVIISDLMSNCKDTLYYEIEVIELPEKPILSVIDNKIVSSSSKNKWFENNIILEVDGNTITPTNTSTYTAIAINDYGCESILSDEIIFNINSVINNYFNVYPNPNKEYFEINLNKIYSELNVEIIDLLGNIVYENKYYNIEKISINHNLKTGVYLLNMNTINNSFYRYKLIVK